MEAQVFDLRNKLVAGRAEVEVGVAAVLPAWGGVAALSTDHRIVLLRVRPVVASITSASLKVQVRTAPPPVLSSYMLHTRQQQWWPSCSEVCSRAPSIPRVCNRSGSWLTSWTACSPRAYTASLSTSRRQTTCGCSTHRGSDTHCDFTALRLAVCLQAPQLWDDR